MKLQYRGTQRPEQVVLAFYVCDPKLNEYNFSSGRMALLLLTVLSMAISAINSSEDITIPRHDLNTVPGNFLI